jgi:hypothetical protein
MEPSDLVWLQTHPLPRGGTDRIESEAYFLFGNDPEDSLGNLTDDLRQVAED